MSERAEAVHDLSGLELTIAEVRTNIEWPFLSQWAFEKNLDRLSSALAGYLSHELGAKVGCSLLYRDKQERYYVGGSSTDRRTMGRSARYYDLGVEQQARSFTGYALLHRISFLLDDFKSACSRFSPEIKHEPKSCEMQADQTLSYVCIPALLAHAPLLYVTEHDDLDPASERTEDLPPGAVRLSSPVLGIASKISPVLPRETLERIFGIIAGGRQRVLVNLDNDALAIADLQTDLLQYKNKEFQGLDQLAFHLQTLFGNCQCSIFIAHPGKRDENGVMKVALYLAATTALNPDPNGQHFIFRRTFFDQNDHYSCYFDVDKRPHETDLAQCPKTARAYYKPQEPVCENENTGSRVFENRGEMRRAGSFLATAIPSRRHSELPYGVIRIVRESTDAFNKKERLLAAAIARALTYWLDFFPKRYELEIRWGSEEIRTEVLKKLFGIGLITPERRGRMAKAEVEFNWLLEKIFFNCTTIEITNLFSGKSGTISLLVKNDSGRDLILKCSKRNPGEADVQNDITREVENYRRYIEGKLQLSHNVIYPELIRETRNLIGFATSFLDSRSRNRISLTQFCRQYRGHLPLVEWSLARVVEKLVADIWAWWYMPEQMGEVESIEMSAFVRLELLGKDFLFGFFSNLRKLDEKVLSDLNHVLGPGAVGETGPYPSPSVLWRTFEAYMDPIVAKERLPSSAGVLLQRPPDRGSSAAGGSHPGCDPETDASKASNALL